ncbi:uncharacterized protein LOC112198166 isoform X2 [Rosa chinensis]|uniref:uncharacterized protein LOC112198166 isoform X2 n=1 Tax=Rosa chinensis TaxID=74649 RepID=UPI001AD8E162|nr:uncharacterized protein LOC112198166 isoform X2 [Rosa chinensis]
MGQKKKKQTPELQHRSFTSSPPLRLRTPASSSSAAPSSALDQCSKLLGYSVQSLHRKRFEEGAEQFRIDVAQNPNDTEESIWCFLCEAQLYGIKEARERFLEVGRDPRPVMREDYIMFKDSGSSSPTEPVILDPPLEGWVFETSNRSHELVAGASKRFDKIRKDVQVLILSLSLLEYCIDPRLISRQCFFKKMLL